MQPLEAADLSTQPSLKESLRLVSSENQRIWKSSYNLIPLKNRAYKISPKSWPCALSFPCTYRRENPSYILAVPCGHSGVSLVWLCRVIRNPWATEAVPGGPGGPCKPSGPGGPCIPREPVHTRETQHTVFINTISCSFRTNVALKGTMVLWLRCFGVGGAGIC